jgi:uncharacterized protein
MPGAQTNPRRKGEGQTALVTGASSGIGLELARCFAKDGYDLVLVARTAGRLEEAASGIAREFGVSAVPIAADLSLPQAGEQLVRELGERGLTVDVLVNDAGYAASGAFDKLDLQTQLNIIDLNVRALVELTHRFLPHMLKNGRGGVLNIASIGAFQPGPYLAVYCATKAFVMSFTEALREETRGTGVHITCFCPGITETAFYKRAGAENIRIFQLGVMSAARSASIGYDAFQANRRVKIAGVQYSLLESLEPFLPRAMTLRLMRLLLTSSETTA